MRISDSRSPCGRPDLRIITINAAVPGELRLPGPRRGGREFIVASDGVGAHPVCSVAQHVDASASCRCRVRYDNPRRGTSAARLAGDACLDLAGRWRVAPLPNKRRRRSKSGCGVQGAALNPANCGIRQDGGWHVLGGPPPWTCFFRRSTCPRGRGHATPRQNHCRSPAGQLLWREAR